MTQEGNVIWYCLCNVAFRVLRQRENSGKIRIHEQAASTIVFGLWQFPRGFSVCLFSVLFAQRAQTALSFPSLLLWKEIVAKTGKKLQTFSLLRVLCRFPPSDGIRSSGMSPKKERKIKILKMIIIITKGRKYIYIYIIKLLPFALKKRKGKRRKESWVQEQWLNGSWVEVAVPPLYDLVPIPVLTFCRCYARYLSIFESTTPTLFTFHYPCWMRENIFF